MKRKQKERLKIRGEFAFFFESQKNIDIYLR
jgi:hypothetical protein